MRKISEEIVCLIYRFNSLISFLLRRGNYRYGHGNDKCEHGNGNQKHSLGKFITFCDTLEISKVFKLHISEEKNITCQHFEQKQNDGMILDILLKFSK